MAIGFSSPLAHVDSDQFVRKEKTFYPTKITVGHHQLRHLISSPQPHVIYLANGCQVYCVNTLTHKKSHVTDLPFDARCTATGYGWFCAGGDDQGYFAAIKIPSASDPTSTTSADREQWPSILDSFDRPMLPSIRVERLGHEIVNSVSLHRLPGALDGHADEIIALLTNNDRTVRMYSLTRDEELSVERFNFPMNHASISPDGRLMMLVGDKELAYFYRRIDGHSPLRPPRWERIRVLRLYVPPDEQGHDVQSFYFTTAWSSCGRLCATGSQDGYIHLLNAEAIASDAPTVEDYVTLIASSRPGTVGGAVRTMCFAPSPWDFLVWVENNGHVGVADVRDKIVTRQIVDLNIAGSDVTTKRLSEAPYDLQPVDFDDELDYIRTQQQALGSGTEPDPERESLRAYRQLFDRARSGDDSREGLTLQERQILDGIRTTRANENSGHTPISINYPSRTTRISSQGRSSNSTNRLDRANHAISETERVVRDYLRDPQTRLSSVDFDFTRQLQYSESRRHIDQLDAQIADINRGVQRLANVIREQESERAALPQSQRADIQHHDHRHTSSDVNEQLMHTIPWRVMRHTMEGGRAETSTIQRETSSPRNSSGLNPPSGRGTPRPRGSSSIGVTLQTSQRERDRDQDLQRDIFQRLHRLTALSEGLAQTETSHDRSSNRAQSRDRLDREQQWQRHVEDLASAQSVLSRRSGLSAFRLRRSWQTADAVGTSASNRATFGVGTAGCCTDGDGRTIYIGTEQGIFELTLNDASRKCWPSLEPR